MKRENPIYTLRPSGKVGIRITKKDLDGFADGSVNENNYVFRMKKDALNSSADPMQFKLSQTHMLRVRRAEPKMEQGVGLRITRSNNAILPDYFGRI